MIFKISNYRNIPPDQTLQFELKDGITFILGPNNVGKSNILSFFYEIRKCIIHVRQDGAPIKYGATVESNFDSLLNRSSSSPLLIFYIGNDLGFLRYIVEPQNANNLNGRNVTVSIELINVSYNTSESRQLIADAVDFFGKLFFIGSLRTHLNQASGASLDLEIGSSFMSMWSNWADSQDIAKIKKTIQLKEELKQIFGFKHFDIRLDREKANFIITNDDGQFLLKELGSGIAQFINVLAKALIDRPNYIIIDEPEISLHPRMQELFVRALASKSKNGLLAASHSIALARSVADNVYTMVKSEQGYPIITKYGQHYHPTIAQSINEMSYSQYVEIGGNNILLVEGRTDIKAFREILRKYGIDNRFIIISFGGSQFMNNDPAKIIEELGEIKRLNPKSIAVIFDSERTSANHDLKPEFKTFKSVCELLGFVVFPTDFHSTENYISQEAIEKILGKGYKSLTPYENFNSISNKWPKEKNWLMFSEMSKNDFEDSDMNNFIKNILVPLSQEGDSNN
jgi:AAA15 family ATPase/GTPase